MQLYQNYNKNNPSYPSWMWKQMRVPWEAVMPERGGQCCSVFFGKRKTYRMEAGAWGIYMERQDELCARLEIMVLGEVIEPGNIGEWLCVAASNLPQAQWPPFFVMKSLEATKPFIQEANLPSEGLKAIASFWYLWGCVISRYLYSWPSANTGAGDTASFSLRSAQSCQVSFFFFFFSSKRLSALLSWRMRCLVLSATHEPSLQ